MKLKLHWQILIALILALICGIAFQHNISTGLESVVLPICAFLGRMFLNALKMIVVPLILSSIICGMMGLGKEKHFGRLGLKTFSYYFLSGLLAILTGLVLVNLVQPGELSEETTRQILGQYGGNTGNIQVALERKGSDFLEIFIRMIPPNIFKAASDNGQLLGIIFFSLLFGFFISRLPDNLRVAQEQFWGGVMRVMLMASDLIIKFAPIGVFSLVTPVMAQTGLEAIGALAKFFFTTLAALAIHLFITLPLIMRFFGLNPLKHFRAVSPALLTAFSTASSAATLPVTMDTTEKNLGVSNRVASFTLPLGATVNMDGTALYECIVVIFIAQISGIELSLATQFSVVLLALLTSIGVAGIPKASLTAIIVILSALDLPVEFMGIVMVTDRILDMCRTSVNVFSDTCGAAVIAKSENENLKSGIKSQKKNEGTI